MAISTAVDASAVARVVGIKTEFKNLRGGAVVNLPQRVAIFGQPSANVAFDPTKRQISSALDAANLYGFGSPIHLSALQLLPANGDGVGSIPVTVYPLEEGVSAAASTHTITVVGTATATSEFVTSTNNINSIPYVATAGDSASVVATAMASAINAELNSPVIAAAAAEVVTLTAKWAGVSSNKVISEVVGPTSAGLTFAITEATGGVVDPSVTDALAQVGDVWETMIVNCLGPESGTAIADFSTWGEGRWGALTRKPALVFGGTVESDVQTAIVIPESRKSDRTNIQIPSPGSKDLPFVVASRVVAREAVVANENPARDYGSQAATGLTPGADSDQWDYTQRDQAVKGGSSTIEVRDGVVTVSDTVTFYHPTGDTTPAYRYACDIVKLQNIIFNLDLTFATPEWDGAPLIPDDQPTTNPAARTPKAARVEVYSVLDALGLAAIISDPKAAKESTVSEIDSQNPKRLNLATTVQLGGNANIISVDLDFGFFFGGA